MTLIIFGLKSIEWFYEKFMSEIENNDYKYELELSIEGPSQKLKDLGEEMKKLAAKTEAFNVTIHKFSEKRNTVNPHERNFKNRRKW